MVLPAMLGRFAAKKIVGFAGRRIKKALGGRMRGRKRHGRKSAQFYAREIRRLKLKRRYDRLRMSI